MKSLRTAALVAGLAAFAPTSHAAFSSAITSYDAGGYGQNTSVNYVDGIRFRPNQDIYVQELGFFDRDSNGLLRSYKVGIVDPASNILGSVMVPSDTAGRLDGPFDPGGLTISNGGFRYVALPEQLHLTAGNTYALVALVTRTATDELPSAVVTFNPLLTFSGTGLGGFFDCRLAASGTGCPTTATQISELRYPTQYSSSSRYLNFTFTITPVPLPAAAWLMVPAVAALGMTRRRTTTL